MLIKAEHKKWARSLYDFYIFRLLKKNFSGIYLLNDKPNIDDSRSLVITPNHFSWWDGFFVDYVMKKFTDKKIHLLMLEEQLKKYWFFRKVGAYSINHNNPKSIIETISYTQEILKSPFNYVVFYPQGEIEPYDKRPLSIKEGIKKFINTKPFTQVLIAAFKIIYGNERKPFVICRFGELLSAGEVIENFDHYNKLIHVNLKKLDEVQFVPGKNNLLQS